MPISLSIDARKNISLTGTSGLTVTVSSVGTSLQFSASDGSSASISVAAGWASINIDTGLTLNIPTSLADGKALPGPGIAVAIAQTTGQNLSVMNLGVDVIQLNAGQAYTLTAAQAAIGRMGATGNLGSLTSTGVLTILATEAADLSALVTDANDIIQLTSGLNYTLTAAQAATARVGATGLAGNFTASTPTTPTGAITIKADAAADLSGLRTDANDTLILTAGRDYVLSSGQAAIAQVGSAGTKGVLASAGTITIKAASGGEVLTSITATGVDILQLTPGASYTLTPAQAALARVGTAGLPGELSSTGTMTIKADLGGENLTAVNIDSSNDVIQLGVGFNYTLTTQQAARARVGTSPTLGNLSTAGIVTLVANPAGENLSTSTILGADAFVLAPGVDYTLNLFQAQRSRVTDSGTAGDLRAAGNVTLKANSGDDLTVLSSLQGIDGYLLGGSTSTYTLTPAQARVARVDSAGRAGNLSGVGPVTLVANTSDDLSTITTDSNDIIVLKEAMDYTLTTAQVTQARVGSATATPGSLFKAGVVKVQALPGDDLSSLANSTISGIDALVLTAGQRYTLATSQGAIAQVGANGTPGVLTGLGPLTVRALTSEDLTLSASVARSASVAAIVLTPGQSYTLTPAQALITRMGSGTLGDLRQVGTTTPGTVTIDAPLSSGQSVDLSDLLTDGNVVVNASPTGSYTVTATQALATRIVSSGGVTSALGDLSSGGIFTIKADTSADLSNLVLRAGDQLLLAAGRNYTLASHQVPLSKVGNFNFGDLAKTGVVNIRANPAGEDLSIIAGSTGIDGYLLTTGSAYTLTAAQAAISRMGSLTALPGVLNGSTAKLIIKGEATSDLSGLQTDSGDEIWLQPNQSYILNSTQALTARILDGSGVPGPAQQLTSTGTIAVRASTATTGEDLTPLAAITGINSYILGSGSTYRLTAAQADLARVGSGPAGTLTGTGVLTIVADTARDLSSLKLDANDVIQLADGVAYTLTAAQAAAARIGTAGALGTLSSSGVMRLLAPTAADLTKVITDSNDQIVLSPTQRYTMTTAQAAVARINSGGTDGAPGALASAGMIRLVAGTVAEDLTGLSLDSGDVIQLTSGTAYTLTAAQAAIAQMGATGTPGSLLSPAVISVIAPANADLTPLVLDQNDQLVLTGARNYTLTPAQAQIAQVESGAVGDLNGLGTITVRASRTGEDLSTAAMLGVSGVDAYQLWPMQNYTLTSAQALIARVGAAGTPANFNAAGVVTIRGSSSNESLVNLASVPGIDGYLLASGVSYTLTAAQAAVARITSGTTTSAAGQLASSPGAITVIASQSADLSALALDAGDSVQLTSGLNYTLTPIQASVSRVVDSTTGTLGAVGALGAAGVVTLRANPLGGDDLSALNVSGIDAIILSASRNYTLSAAQANVAQVPGSTVGNLSKAGVITVRAATAGENLATGLTATGVDFIQLTPEASYTLTSAQAAISRMGTSTSLGSLQSGGALTILAGSSANLTKIGLDLGDTIVLTGGSGQTYALTPSQANIAKVGTSGVTGSLSDAAQINIVAAPLGDDLARMSASGVDAILLTAGAPYTLTSDQAALARVGSLTASAGQLAKAGSITLRSIGTESFVLANMNNWSVDGLQLTATSGTVTTGVTYTIPTSLLAGLRLQVGTGTGLAYTTLSLAPATDTSAAGDNLIGASNNPLGVSSTAVDYRGEWSFNTQSKELRIHDGTAVQTVVLVGVNLIEADGSSFFKASP